MGLSFGVVAVLATSGRLPYRSYASSPFFILPLGVAIKYRLIYIYIVIFIKVVENLCRYTPEPSQLQPQRVRILGPRLDMQHLPNEGRLHKPS
jgi:hypothetical protein